MSAQINLSSLRYLVYLPVLFLTAFIHHSFAQTALSEGDIVVIGFKTNTSTQSGDDCVKLLTLVDLECGTTFIGTDNNWRNTGTWYCNNDEFAVEITVTSEVSAGSVIYINTDDIGKPVSVSSGAITRTDLLGNWGNNCGFNSKGDNFFVLQGDRNNPQFIYGFRHKDTFSSGGDCGSKNNTSLPGNLTLGTSAIEMSSDEDQWHYNCSSALTSGTRAALMASVSNASNWTYNGGQSWNSGTCSFFVTDAPIDGLLGVTGSGCGCLSGCNLSSLAGPNCGSGTSGNCAAGEVAMSTDIDVPSGCTYKVYATMRKWTGCSASGADSGDKLKVDDVSGAKSFQTGSSNATLEDSYTLTGPGTIRVSGTANRADEVITYKITPVSAGTCTSCSISALAVELEQFNAFRENDAVKLIWSTASEKYSDYFEITKSTDGENWEAVSNVMAAGFSTNEIRYNIWDLSPYRSGSYYKLVEIDQNGKRSAPAIVYVEEKAIGEVIRRVNLMGQEVDEYYRGVVIQYYSNGDIRKVLN